MPIRGHNSDVMIIGYGHMNPKCLGQKKSTGVIQDEEEDAEIGVKERLKMDKVRHKRPVARHDI